MKAGWLIFAGIIWLPLAIHAPGGFVSECIFICIYIYIVAANTGRLKMQSIIAFCFCFSFFLLTQMLKGECMKELLSWNTLVNNDCRILWLQKGWLALCFFPERKISSAFFFFSSNTPGTKQRKKKKTSNPSSCLAVGTTL